MDKKVTSAAGVRLLLGRRPTPARWQPGPRACIRLAVESFSLTRADAAALRFSTLVFSSCSALSVADAASFCRSGGEGNRHASWCARASQRTSPQERGGGGAALSGPPGAP